MSYDSTADTKDHQERVRMFMADCIDILTNRANNHDASKLEECEKPIFDKFTPKLKDSEYDSDEYKANLKAMGVALEHHYENNPHHPEHFTNGVRGMTLMDLIEMLCDWKAAGMRHKNGSIEKSINLNQMRFGYSDELHQILWNTAKHLVGGHPL